MIELAQLLVSPNPKFPKPFSVQNSVERFSKCLGSTFVDLIMHGNNHPSAIRMLEQHMTASLSHRNVSRYPLPPKENSPSLNFQIQFLGSGPYFPRKA